MRINLPRRVFKYFPQKDHCYHWCRSNGSVVWIKNPIIICCLLNYVIAEIMLRCCEWKDLAIVEEVEV